MLGSGSYYTGSFVNNFGFTNRDILTALDLCYDQGIVGIGNLDYGSTGGSNLFIVRVDKNNTGGPITILSELSNENITLSFHENKQTFKGIDTYPNPFKGKLKITGLPEKNKIHRAWENKLTRKVHTSISESAVTIQKK